MRKFFIVIIVLLSAAVIVLGSNFALVTAQLAARKLPIYCVAMPESDKAVSITFDAAWGADKTEKILTELDNYNIKATFFLCGLWVKKYPELVKTIHGKGHEIGTHSDTHPDMTKISAASVRQELKVSKEAIENIIGETVTVFRPPFGAYNDTLIETANELNLYTIQWDVDSLDWKGLSAASIAGRVFSRTKSGSVILMHNDADNVIGAVRLVADNLLKNGYRFRTVSELIYKDNYKIDHTGRQIKLQ
jgi:polysaccharide deacetylase family sporulation protein PdaB